MNFLSQLRSKFTFDTNTNRLGPDIPFTHWKLHFKHSAEKLCQKKFGFFGKNSQFRPGAYAINTDKIYIGENVTIRPGTMIFGDLCDEKFSIMIENNVLIAAGVHIYVNNHIFSDPHHPIIDQGHTDAKPVIIKSGAWIGANAIILPGITIGKNSVIGAGSVVTKSIEAGAIAVGSPAKIIRKNT